VLFSPERQIGLDLLSGTFVNHRADIGAWFLREANLQGGRPPRPIVVRAVRSLCRSESNERVQNILSLKAKSGMNDSEHRLIEIGVGIDNRGVLSAHLANDLLQITLA